MTGSTEQKRTRAPRIRASTGTDPSEARALLQDRLVVYLGTLAVLWGSAWIINGALNAVFFSGSDRALIPQPRPASRRH